MTRLVTTMLAVAAAALAFSGTALAAFAPRLIVDESNYGPSATPSTTEIEVIANRDDNSIAKLTIYAPTGYAATGGQAIGTDIGTASAQVQAKEIGENAILDVNGFVRVADGSAAALRQAAVACTGTATHDAFWLLALTAAGTPLNIPVFVDRASAAESVFASSKLQVCFTSPEIPSSKGGAPFGAKILDAVLDLRSIFTNPSFRGEATWRGVFTPYLPGTGTPNPAGTVESRGIVSLPSSLTLSAKYVAKTNTYRLGGTLTEGTVKSAGERIQIFRATKAALSSFKAFARATTTGKGTYAKSGKLKPRRPTYFLAVRPAHSVEESGGCGAPVVLPVPCVTATVSDVFSPIRKLTPKKR